MARRLKLGLDVDGVLADFVSAFRQEAEAFLHRPFPRYNTDWDFGDWDISKKEYSELWKIIRNSKDWFLNLQPLPGVPHALMLLEYAKHDLFFITNRIETKGDSVERQTSRWLEYNCGTRFPIVVVAKDKGPEVAQRELDAFIDDKPENLFRIAEMSPKTKLFLRDQPYNATFELPEGWTRVGTLDEFSRALEGL